MVRMRAEFVGPFGRHEHNLQMIEPCLHMVLCFTMFKKVKKPAAYEIQCVIRFLNARNMKLADIHQLCEVYGEHVMNDSMIRRWARHFNEGRENVHGAPWSGQQSLVNEDLVSAVKKRFKGVDNSPFCYFPCTFHNIFG
jgi:hypothetical protein